MRDLRGKVSIIMPAYNEEEHIAAGIEETARTFNGFGCSWELLVMDDGSTDNTYDAALRVAAKYAPQVIVKRIPLNLGKGRALKKSIRYLSGDYVVFLDADLDLHPIQIQALFDMMHLVDADIVIGSKLHPNSQVNYPPQRKFISMGYYLLVRLLFNLPCHDTQTGIKLFKAEVLKKVLPRVLVKKFAFDLEVLVNAHHLGYKIAEVPVVIKDQRKRHGSIGIGAIYTTLWDTLAVFYRMNILKYYDHIDYYRRKNLAKEFRRMRR